MKKQEKTVSARNKKQTPPLKHQSRDWKFWCMVVLTVFWCGLFGVAIVNNAKKTSMSQWWADQIKVEDKTLPPTVLRPQTKKNNSTMHYTKDGDYYQLNFDILSSFPASKSILDKSAIQTKSIAAPIPAAIQALSGEKISVAGFMIPMVTDKDQASSFILAQTRGSCCYGLVPKLNQWIYVQMNQGRTAEISMDIPVTVFGTLTVSHCSKKQSEDWCLYRMAGDEAKLSKQTWF